MSFPQSYMEHFSVDGDQPANLARMSIRWHDCRIFCDVEYDQNKSPVEYGLINDFVEASNVEDEAGQMESEYQLYEIIVELGADRFNEISTEMTLTNLEALYVPREYRFSLKNVNGSSQLIQEHVEGNSVDGPQWTQLLHLSDPRFNSLPRYEAKDIEVLAIWRKSGELTKVRAGGQVMVAMTHFHDIMEIGRQLWGGVDIMNKAEQQKKDINIPKILGVIEIKNNVDVDGKDIMVGILREHVVGNPFEDDEGYIPATISKWSQEVRDGILVEEKQGWLKQVQETVDWLHKNDQVWAVGGPQNVLIEGLTGKAWLLGCGESGLDDRSMKNAVFQDGLALWRVADFLGLEATMPKLLHESESEDRGYCSANT